jgi:thioredoxin-like negative regulator of GroEL
VSLELLDGSSLKGTTVLALSAQVALHLAIVAANGSDYEGAYKEAFKQNKPLLILVGAEWCPACRTMQEDSLPTLEKQGGLKNVVFTKVDADEEPKLAKQLMSGSAIPQLILYAPKKEGWHRAQLTGAFSSDQIGNFLKREISSAANNKTARTASAEFSQADR